MAENTLGYDGNSMPTGTNSVLNSVSPAKDSFPQQERVDHDNAELSEAYVLSLASLGLERLQNEPGRLHAEAIAVDEALHSLSLDHYRVFIQNQECVRHVRAQGQEMDNHLSSLLTEIHGLGSEFSVFQREAVELVGGHKRNRQTLKHHMQLVELLEVPQIMDACVRSDLLEEALSIATFASTLERRHRSRRLTGVSSISAGKGDGETERTGAGTEEGHLPGVIKMIVDEVRESARGLHERLLAKLRGSIQLTNCLQVVSCLRRLELLNLEEKNRRKQLKRQQQQQAGGGGRGAKGSEAAAALQSSSGSSGVSRRQLALVEMKLQVDFLEARDAWLVDAASRANNAGNLQQALGGVSSSSPYQSLMDLIESSRSQWFEVATQFRAIFLSDSGSASGAEKPERRHLHLCPCARPRCHLCLLRDFAYRSNPGGRSSGSSSGSSSGDVLSLWLLRRVTAFVGQLRTILPLVEDGASLRSLLEECMFFGASMGRLGTDFRGLLVPVFQERVIGAASAQWSAASAGFVVNLRDVAAIEASGGNGSSLLHVPDKSSHSMHEGIGGRAGAGGVAAEASLYGDDEPPSPPRSLMAFPPLARLVNQILTSFNQLRECLPVSVEKRLTENLVRCFSDAFRGLADLQKATVRVSAASAASGAAPSSGSRTRGSAAPLTTALAVELTCAAFADQAVPHVALCFAFLFGETPSIAATTPASSAAKGREGRRQRFEDLLRDSMESFAIYERKKAPPPTPSPSAAVPSASPADSGFTAHQPDGTHANDDVLNAAANASTPAVERTDTKQAPSDSVAASTGVSPSKTPGGRESRNGYAVDSDESIVAQTTTPKVDMP